MNITNNRLANKDILSWALWFGSVSGLIEGLALWSLYQLGWLSGKLSILGTAPENIWVSALFNILLFMFLGLFFVVLGKIVPFLTLNFVVASIFILVLVFDWLNILLNGRISILAITVLALGVAAQYYWSFQKNRNTTGKIIRKSQGILISLVALAFIGIQGAQFTRELIAISSLPTADQNMPNIVVIVVDTLRADHLSSYGYEKPTSKNIDTLAQEGVLFENAYATAPYTLPSHASMLTGLYTFSHQAYDTPLDNKYPTLGESLQSLGYRTAAFSANVSTFNRSNGLGRGFIHFEDHFQSIGDTVKNTVYGRLFEYYFLHKILDYEDELGRLNAADINNATLNWIQKQEEEPFFIFINYYDVHSPYIPPDQFYEVRGITDNNLGGLISSYWGTENLYVELSKEQLQSEIEAYDDCITYVDDNIGQLLADLKKQNLLDNTIFVITSDHGESFDEHGLRGHANALYRELIHVPLVIWWPGHIPVNTRISKPVSLVELPTTILNLIGKDFQEEIDYPALSGLWEADASQVDIPFPLVELGKIDWAPVQNPSAYGAMKSVINSDWQYITHDTFGEELYNLKDDPQETNNVAGNSQESGTLEYFRSYFEKSLTGQ